jgi:hypothetical protein
MSEKYITDIKVDNRFSEATQGQKTAGAAIGNIYEEAKNKRVCLSYEEWSAATALAWGLNLENLSVDENKRLRRESLETAILYF